VVPIFFCTSWNCVPSGSDDEEEEAVEGGETTTTTPATVFLTKLWATFTCFVAGFLGEKDGQFREGFLYAF
jgi:hypothetical protein